MASICNDERASFGVMSGHDRKTLSLSVALAGFYAKARRLASTDGGWQGDAALASRGGALKPGPHLCAAGR